MAADAEVNNTPAAAAATPPSTSSRGNIITRHTGRFPWICFKLRHPPKLETPHHYLRRNRFGNSFRLYLWVNSYFAVPREIVAAAVGIGGGGGSTNEVDHSDNIRVVKLTTRAQRVIPLRGILRAAHMT